MTTTPAFAVPEGPSRDPHDKRFATPTQDHPLEYRDFEGVIPPGEHGRRGTVIVRGGGTCRNLSTDRSGHGVPRADALRQGHASFRLAGRQPHGGYPFTRIRTPQDEGRGARLLAKHAGERAASAGTPAPRRARSARTGGTLGQVAAAAPAGERR